MTRPSFLLRAVAAICIPASVLSAQPTATVAFEEGTRFNAAAITTIETTGARMEGMRVSVEKVGVGTLSGTWGEIGSGFCGVKLGDPDRFVSIYTSCSDDTFQFFNSWNVENFSDYLVTSVRFNGAPGRTLFDCGWSGSACVAGVGTEFGTESSFSGRTLTATGGSFEGRVSAVYANQVGIAGALPVGDLFEQLTLSFSGGREDGALGINESFIFTADTDNSDFRFDPPSPVGPPDPEGPPVSVPEPSAVVLAIAGALGLLTRARGRRLFG